MIKQLSFTIAAVLLLGYIEPSHQASIPPTAAVKAHVSTANVSSANVSTANVSNAEKGLCWTQYYNEDHPRFTGDDESLKKLRKKYPGEICERPQKIQAVRVDNGTPAEKTGQIFYAYNNEIGFICRNQDQKKGESCFDYKVRFGCPC